MEGNSGFDLGLMPCPLTAQKCPAVSLFVFSSNLLVPFSRRRWWPQRSFEGIFACPSVHREVEQGTERRPVPETVGVSTRWGRPSRTQLQYFSNQWG